MYQYDKNSHKYHIIIIMLQKELIISFYNSVK